MSMKMLTVLQIAETLAAYLGVTMVLPWILFRKRFTDKKLSVRLMMYFVCGNFYVINMVILLQLFHISYRPTLIIGTLVPFGIAAGVRFRKSFAMSLEQGTRKIRVIFEGELGIKTQLYRMGKKLQRLSSGLLGEWMAPRWPDIVLTLGIVGLVLYMYGTTAVNTYGYGASDIVVHNYWINDLVNNHIFTAGVYPHGFHIVIYYLHEVFSIPIYVLLRIFYVVQVLMIHLMLLFFLRAVCKSKYAPYVGTFLFAAADLFSMSAYSRYYASLPQEFGMLFILPSVYFAIAFFQEKEFIPDKGNGKKRLWHNFSLNMFAISVSLTLAVHFYDTFIVAFFCAGLAVGFYFRCFRWRYLKQIVMTGIIGIMLAVAPMGAAYITGTPLEGSLYWGMSEISSSQEESSEADGILYSIQDKMRDYVAKGNTVTAWFMLGSTAVLFFLGIVWFILKKKEYGGMLVSVSIFMMMLFLFQDSADTGLPQMIAAWRYSIYIVYCLGIVWALGVDALLLLLFKEKESIHLGSFVVLILVCIVTVMNGIRTPMKLDGQEPNDAIICLTNIIRENRGGGTWTICSANDERTMIREQGYHYELIDFLRKMENITDTASVTVPTKTVYFFVEKVPIKAEMEDKGKRVSLEGAERALPEGSLISIYEKDSRWVVMSRFYYWAQAFQRLYPNEMEVYYETDDFVCYRVRQNEYDLYNFAIDYGYN